MRKNLKKKLIVSIHKISLLKLHQRNNHLLKIAFKRRLLILKDAWMKKLEIYKTTIMSRLTFQLIFPQIRMLQFQLISPIRFKMSRRKLKIIKMILWLSLKKSWMRKYNHCKAIVKIRNWILVKFNQLMKVSIYLKVPLIKSF